MSRQRYAVTRVWRGIGAEIAMALRSRGYRFTDFRRSSIGLDDFIHSRSFRHGVDHVGCSKILPLHALTR